MRSFAVLALTLTLCLLALGTADACKVHEDCQGRGLCQPSAFNASITVCNCNKFYSGNPYNSTCEYERFGQAEAWFLQFAFPYLGAGFFYLGNMSMGVATFLLGSFLLLLWPLGPFLCKRLCCTDIQLDPSMYSLTHKCILGALLTVNQILYIYSLVELGGTKWEDGNGYTLASWYKYSL